MYSRTHQRIVPVRQLGMPLTMAGAGRRGGNIFRRAHNYIKRNRLASKALKAYSQVGLPGAQHASKASEVAESLGYGRRGGRRRRGKQLSVSAQRGGNILKDINKFAKETGIVSKGLRGLSALPIPGANYVRMAGDAAANLGYGRRGGRRRRRPRRY